MEPATSPGMWRDHYEETSLIGTRRSRKGGVLLIAVAAIALAAGAVWLSPGGGGGQRVGGGLVRTESGMAGSVGTSGQLGENARAGNSGPALSTLAGNPIRDLETITGATDGHELVGRRVDLHVPVQQHINDVAFWVGPRDNRLLVVLARDTRDGEERQRGEPSNSGVSALQAGQATTISGTIQKVPYAEAMYSWGLTNADRTELMDRRIYLRADSVQ